MWKTDAAGRAVVPRRQTCTSPGIIRNYLSLQLKARMEGMPDAGLWDGEGRITWDRGRFAFPGPSLPIDTRDFAGDHVFSEFFTPIFLI